MKKPWLAFLCSFFVPGAGLAYLGNWLAGIVNLCLATLIVVGFMMVQPDQSLDYLHYVILVIAAGSGGFAHAWSLRANRRRVENE